MVSQMEEIPTEIGKQSMLVTSRDVDKKSKNMTRNLGPRLIPGKKFHIKLSEWEADPHWKKFVNPSRQSTKPNKKSIHTPPLLVPAI